MGDRPHKNMDEEKVDALMIELDLTIEQIREIDRQISAAEAELKNKLRQLEENGQQQEVCEKAIAQILGIEVQ